MARFVAILAVLAGAAQSHAGDVEGSYEDYPRFQKDMGAMCRGLQAPGVDPKMPVGDRQIIASHRALEDGNAGEDAKKILNAVDNTNPEDKWSVFLAAAGEANLARCAVAEEGYRVKSHELKQACGNGDAKACQTRTGFLRKLDAFIDDFIKVARAECAKGRKHQCEMPRQYEQMKQDFEAGTLPK
jgi:hypothetical protein